MTKKYRVNQTTYKIWIKRLNRLLYSYCPYIFHKNKYIRDCVRQNDDLVRSSMAALSLWKHYKPTNNERMFDWLHDSLRS